VGVRDKGEGVCELEMEMFMQPSIYVPFGIRSMVGGQVRRQLRGVLSNLQQRFEERAAKARERQDEGRRVGFGPPQWLQVHQRHWQQQLQQQPPWWMSIDIVAAA